MHLDVKPANVLVTSRESAAEHVYVADFGLTRRGATGHRTRGGDFLGSPTYAAPEHLRGEPVDARTDAYSLACVLFACLAGRPPYQGDGARGDPGPPEPGRAVAHRRRCRTCRAAIDEVIRRGMAKTPTQRYATCRELIAAARQALTQPVRRPPAVPVGTSRRAARRRPTRGSRARRRAATSARPCSHRATPVRLRPPAPAGSSTAFTSSRPSGGNRWIAPVLVGIVAIGLIVAAIFLLRRGDDPGTDSPGGTEQTTTPTTTKSVPSIKVGDDSGGSTETSGADLHFLHSRG